MAEITFRTGGPRRVNNNVRVTGGGLTAGFVLFALFIIFIGFINSKSNSQSKFLEVYDKVLIFYAPWCGHCKRSMPEFEKAERFGNGKVILVNSDDPKNEKLVSDYGVKGYPTIMKQGNIYDGPRTADKIVEFANETE